MLGSHALRRRLGLAPFYAVLGAYIAVASLAPNAGLDIQIGGFSFIIGSVVFYTAIMLGVFALYVCDGPHAMRSAVVILAFVSLAAHTTAAGLHHLYEQAGIQWPAALAANSLRIVAARLSGRLGRPAVSGHGLGVFGRAHGLEQPAAQNLAHPAGAACGWAP